MEQLLAFVKQDYPKLTWVTLNVERDNNHAQELYVKKGFIEVSAQDAKTFMGLSMTQQEEQKLLSAETAKNIVRDYVLKNASVAKLAYWEGVRHGGEAISKLRWDHKNPDYETVALSD